MDLNRLCTACLNERGDSDICPFCGTNENLTTESPQHLAPRTILYGKYMLGRVLGQGGFGITYLAWDINLNRKLAIKEYLPRDFASRSPDETMVSVFSGNAQNYFQDGLEKFLEEARTLARFDGHPNIVAIRDFFRANSTAYLVMTYLEGITLKDYLQQERLTLDFATALSIMMPVMDALAEVHKVGVLHRDISPDNIFITQNKIVKVLDFGAARHALGEHSKSLSVILKPGYAPEEQYRSRGQQGAWTDVYAVAATMYRVLCGRTPPESLDRMHEDTLIPPSQLNVDIPAYAEQALLKALSIRHTQRFQTMREFQEAISSSSQQANISSSSTYSAPIYSEGGQLSACNKCGSALSVGQNFCTACGNKSHNLSGAAQSKNPSSAASSNPVLSPRPLIEARNEPRQEPIRQKKANKALIGCLVFFAIIAVLLFAFLLWVAWEMDNQDPLAQNLHFAYEVDPTNLVLNNTSDTFYADEEFYFFYDNKYPFNSNTIRVQLVNASDNSILLEHDYEVNPDYDVIYDWVGFSSPGRYKVVIMIDYNVVASREVRII